MYPVQQQRPTGVTLLAVLMIIEGVLWLTATFLLGLFVFFAAAILVCFAVFAIIALFYFIVAWGLWTLQPWARTMAILLAILSLFNVPIGTIIGIIVLIYLFQPEIKAAFGEGPVPVYGQPYVPYAPPGYAPPGYPPQYPPQQPGYAPQQPYQQPAYQQPPAQPAQAPPAAAPPAGGKCKNCGASLNPGVAFCPNCGSRVT